MLRRDASGSPSSSAPRDASNPQDHETGRRRDWRDRNRANGERLACIGIVVRGAGRVVDISVSPSEKVKVIRIALVFVHVPIKGIYTVVKPCRYRRTIPCERKGRIG